MVIVMNGINSVITERLKVEHMALVCDIVYTDDIKNSLLRGSKFDNRTDAIPCMNAILFTIL